MTPWTLLRKTFEDLRAIILDDTVDPATRVELCKAVMEGRGERPTYGSSGKGAIQKVTALITLGGLIERIESGQVQVESISARSPVKEVDPEDGWRKWRLTGDTYLTVHFTEREKP